MGLLAPVSSLSSGLLGKDYFSSLGILSPEISNCYRLLSVSCLLVT